MVRTRGSCRLFEESLEVREKVIRVSCKHQELVILYNIKSKDRVKMLGGIYKSFLAKAY